MANQDIYVKSDRFESLIVAPKAWLLYLPVVPYLAIGDTLTVHEVDHTGLYLGRYRVGICELIKTPNFFNITPTEQCYYFNPLEMPVQIYNKAILKSNATVTHTGDILETILYSQLIPAGTMAINDVLRVLVHFSTTSGAGVSTVRIRLGTSAVIAGSSIAGMANIAITQLGSVPFIRNIVFKNSLSTQEIATNAASLNTDEATNATLVDVTLSVNFANDVYFMVTTQGAANTSSCSMRNMYGYIVR